jgi:hypothetical protein
VRDGELMTQGDDFQLDLGLAAKPDAERPKQGMEDRKHGVEPKSRSA